MDFKPLSPEFIGALKEQANEAIRTETGSGKGLTPYPIVIALRCPLGHPIEVHETSDFYEHVTGCVVRALCTGGEMVHQW